MNTPRRILAVTAVAMGLVGLAQCGKPPALDKQPRYTCPMHPEVVRDTPGTCPKCGMALEAMEAPIRPAGDARR